MVDGYPLYTSEAILLEYIIKSGVAYRTDSVIL